VRIESSDEASLILGGALTSKLIAVLATALPMTIVDHRTISAATKHITSTRETATSLGARYAIEGCVRSWGGNWRVDASLIDVGTGRHLCSESFRHTDGDLFELADNFALRISTRFAPQVEAVERQRTMIDKVGVLKHFHRSCALLFHRSINFKTNARNSLIGIFSDTGALIRAQYLRVGLLAAILFIISPPFAGSFQDAIAAGDIGNVRLQIARGANVNKPDPMMGLPLMIAARGNHIEIAEALLKHGADVNGWDISGAVLHAAAYGGHTAMVKFLISRGADVNGSPDGKTTPLNFAAANGHIDTIKLLIQSGALVNPASGHTSPLHLSALAGHKAAVELLIANGADINLSMGENDRPLHFAITGGHIGVVKLLIDLGADIEARGYHAYTPLYLARTRRDLTNIVELLTARGARL
jgi:ankyrin repeat protein